MNPKTALVTGGTSGIGMQISFALVKKGVNVIIAGRDFRVVSKELNSRFGQFGSWSFIEADFVYDEDLEKLIQKVKMTTDRLEYLIHSAGVFYSGHIEEASISHLDELYKVNTRAPYYITKGLLNLIKKARGRIIFINSTAGLNSWKSIGQYAATKHALSAIAGSFQAELESFGIRVTSVYPAATDTPMQKKIHESEGREYNPEKLMPAKEVADIIVDMFSASSKTVVSEIVIRSLNSRLFTEKTGAHG